MHRRRSNPRHAIGLRVHGLKRPAIETGNGSFHQSRNFRLLHPLPALKQNCFQTLNRERVTLTHCRSQRDLPHPLLVVSSLVRDYKHSIGPPLESSFQGLRRLKSKSAPDHDGKVESSLLSMPVRSSFTARSSLLIVLLVSIKEWRAGPSPGVSLPLRCDPAKYRARAT